MGSEDKTLMKKYVDACVQTSSELIDPVSAPTLATPSHAAKHVTYAGHSAPGIRSEDSPAGRVYPRTPIALAKHHHAYKQLGHYDSPSAAVVDRRLVSLPARIEENTLSEQLSRSLATGSRSVSMPTKLRRVTRTITQHDDSTLYSTSFSSSDEYPSEGPASHTYDAPYTPSLLSDSNSFDVIDEKFSGVQHFAPASGTTREKLTISHGGAFSYAFAASYLSNNRHKRLGHLVRVTSPSYSSSTWPSFPPLREVPIVSFYHRASMKYP